MPKKKGKPASPEVMEEMQAGYENDAIAGHLNEVFLKLEERSNAGIAGSDNFISGGLDRGDHILIDGRTIKEILAENYAEDHGGLLGGFEGAYKSDRINTVNKMVAEALLSGRHVDVYIPDPDTGKIGEPSQFQGKGFAQSVIERPAQLTRWQKFWSRFGFYRNKVEELEIYDRRKAAPKRVQFYNKVGRAHMARSASMAEGVAAAWKERYPKRKDLDMNKIPDHGPYRLGRNAMTVWVNCYLATRKGADEKLLYSNEQLLDMQNPDMQKARADAAETIFQKSQERPRGDEDWLYALAHQSRIALKARIDEQGRKLDFTKGDVTEQEGYRGFSMLVSTGFEVTQEIRGDDMKAILTQKYGENEYEQLQADLGDLPNGLRFLEGSLDAQKRMLYGGVMKDPQSVEKEMACVVTGKAFLQLCAEKQKKSVPPTEYVKIDECWKFVNIENNVQNYGKEDKDLTRVEFNPNELAQVLAVERLGKEYIDDSEKISKQIVDGTLEERIQTKLDGETLSVEVDGEPTKERQPEPSMAVG